MQLTEEQKKDIVKKRSKRFVRQDINKKSRLEEKWHYPKGIHSKLRHRRRGYGLIVKTGYKTPKFIRGRTLDGKKLVTVKNMAELLSLKNVQDNFTIQLSSTLGKRKRIEILSKILELKLPYSGDADKEIEIIKELLNQRKALRKSKKSRKMKKGSKEKEHKKEESKEDKSEEAPTEESEKKKEKKEFDKLLTKEK